MKIYVGAGHSNKDPGAVANGFEEARLMTELRNLVAAALTQQGAQVITDGQGSENLPLVESIKLAKQADSDRRIELHLNAGPNTAKGVECLSLPAQKVKVQAIAKAISQTLNVPLRGESGWKPDDSGQHPRLGFCRQAGGIVVECSFITNKAEIISLRRNQVDLATAIAKVLMS